MRKGAVWGIVLAAGRGSRFQGDVPKLLDRFRGRPLVQHTLESLTVARRAGVLAGNITVIAGGATEMARAVGGTGTFIVENPEPAQGLASSLRLGIERLDNPPVQPEAAAALVVLGDQPLVRRDVIAALVEAWRAGADIVRPTYRDAPKAPGHPLLLDRGRWPLIETLTGDRGLGEILAGHPEWVTTILLAGSNPDIDTAADLAALEDIS